MTVGFWITAGALTLIAVAFLLVPLAVERRRSGQQSTSGMLVALAVVPVSIGLYFAATTFDPDIDAGATQEQMALLDQLAARLSSNPNDINGWVLLGRSYMSLGDFDRARLALEQAWSRTDAPDDTLKVAYAETLMRTEAGAALTLAGDLVEEVLQASPGNGNALFLGGIVAIERDQPSLAAERWTALLATNPPPEVADILREQIRSLTGVSVSRESVAESGGASIEVDVSLADSVVLDSFEQTALLFVIATSPDSPAPVAVERHPLTALPGRFTLSDADAMIPTRQLSQYGEVTVIARISRSGEPTAQPGDVFAEAIVATQAGEPISLVIGQTVP